jgi:hypothetical protein
MISAEGGALLLALPLSIFVISNIALLPINYYLPDHSWDGGGYVLAAPSSS